MCYPVTLALEIKAILLIAIQLKNLYLLLYHRLVITVLKLYARVKYMSSLPKVEEELQESETEEEVEEEPPAN